MGLGVGVSAPTRPKTEAEAPTERTSGRKTADTIVPKMPDNKLRLPIRHEPKLRSSGTWVGGRRRRNRRPESLSTAATLHPHGELRGHP